MRLGFRALTACISRAGKSWAAGFGAAVLVAACGGGADPSDNQPLASPERAAAAKAAAAPDIAPATVFEYAQNAYPEYFSGVPSDGTFGPYTYRYYSGTGNYIGVADGYVYLMGPTLTNNEILRLAEVNDFRCHLVVNSCVEQWKATMIDALNAARRSAGVTEVSAHPALAAGAQGHAAYSLVHYYANGVQNPIMFTYDAQGRMMAHTEVPGLPGFVGETPADRAIGYGPMVGEVAGALFGPRAHTEPDVPSCMASLVGTVFHRAALLNPRNQHIGVGVSDFVFDYVNHKLRVCVINTGVQTEPTLPADWVATYPGPGLTGVPTTMSPEAPDPAPGFTKGYPVSVQVQPGMTLTVTSFRLTASNGVDLPTVLVTGHSSPYLDKAEAYLVPKEALSRNALYTVSFVGSAVGAAGSVAINRQWTFATAP